LRQEAVEEEGEGETAHGDRHADGVDDGLHHLGHRLLHVEADVGEVDQVALEDVAVVVGHQELVNAVLVTP